VDCARCMDPISATCMLITKADFPPSAHARTPCIGPVGPRVKVPYLVSRPVVACHLGPVCLRPGAGNRAN
jgi:hypothetical protein